MLKESKLSPPTTTPKLEQVIELSGDLDKMVAKSTEEFDVEAPLAKPTKFVIEEEYLENLLDDLLVNDEILDELQDDPTMIATIGNLPIKLVITGTWRRCNGRGNQVCSFTPRKAKRNKV